MNSGYERVAQLIRDAFAGVTLGNGVGLWEGRALDDYADDNGIAAARRRDERKDWKAIPIDDLCECESSLTFADAEGVRFLLPAFLLAQLADKLPAGIIYTLVDYWDPRNHFSMLSPAQRKAVREFLLVLKDESDYAFDKQLIERSLNDFWTEEFVA